MPDGAAGRRGAGRSGCARRGVLGGLCHLRGACARLVRGVEALARAGQAAGSGKQNAPVWKMDLAKPRKAPPRRACADAALDGGRFAGQRFARGRGAARACLRAVRAWLVRGEAALARARPALRPERQPAAGWGMAAAEPPAHCRLCMCDSAVGRPPGAFPAGWRAVSGGCGRARLAGAARLAAVWPEAPSACELEVLPARSVDSEGVCALCRGRHGDCDVRLVDGRADD